ncbi:MAG: D-glycero-beta-D-manno-heptose 1,7-bisphosphate 7-phosphatase [Anaerolineae bacterium]
MSDTQARAVFLDRDGVINANRDDYVKTWDEVEILPGALEALARLAQTGYRVVLTSNQSPIGRALVTTEAVEAIHARLRARIEAAGGRLDAIYFCPHRPEDGCPCRKPAPGMLLQAARDLDLSLADSYMVGDALSDVEAGQRAGATAILVLSGRGQAQLAQPRPPGLRPFHIVPNLAEAVALILALDAGRQGRAAESGDQ